MAEAIPSIGRSVISTMSWYLGETITKIITFSSLGAGIRWLIDKFFELFK